ncbi:MAG: hypothetical protein R3250_09730 [Melioribacteraceae bacterium]|nr:hypothetical protein [Melioribacteraceae bacterium]
MKKTFVILILSSIIILANNEPTAVDKKIMDYGLNFEFDKADSLLAEQIKISENLKNHFLYLNVELLKVIKATDDAPYTKRRAVKDSLNGLLIKYAEKVVEDYEDSELSIYDQFYMASVYGVLGRLYGVTREMMSAFSAGKDGRNLMEEVIEQDPDFIDAYLLLGMMNYYADRLGGFIEFVAAILGLSGDRDVGLAYLEKVEKNGEINNWQATMILIELYSRLEGNKFDALPLLQKMVDRFPNNSHFKNWLCYEYLNLHQLNNAGEMISIDYNGAINDFVKAAYFHQSGQYNKSNEIYNQILSEKGRIWRWLYENAKYNRVLNYFYLDEEDKSDNLSVELNEEYKERYDNLKRNKETAVELMKFMIAVSSDDFETADKYIQELNDFGDFVTAEASYNYFKGVYSFKKKQLDEAEKFFIKSKEISFDDFGYSSVIYLIHIYKLNDVAVEKVEKLLDDVDDLDNEGLDFYAQDLEAKYDL